MFLSSIGRLKSPTCECAGLHTASRLVSSLANSLAKACGHSTASVTYCNCNCYCTRLPRGCARWSVRQLRLWPIARHECPTGLCVIFARLGRRAKSRNKWARAIGQVPMRTGQPSAGITQNSPKSKLPPRDEIIYLFVWPVDYF